MTGDPRSRRAVSREAATSLWPVDATASAVLPNDGDDVATPRWIRRNAPGSESSQRSHCARMATTLKRGAVAECFALHAGRTDFGAGLDKTEPR